MRAFNARAGSVGIAALLFALALPCAVSFGQSPVTLPHQQHWEDFAPDASPIGTEGWFGETNAYAIVTNMTYTWTHDRPELDPPAPSTNRVLRLDTENSSISNVLANTSGNTNVTVDAMIQFVFSPDEDAQGIITNDNTIQTAYYVNSNGWLTVYHLHPIAGTNAFSTLNYDCDALETGEWARVTLEFDFQTSEPSFTFFRIALNGNFFTNSLALDIPHATDGIFGGEWFVGVNRTTTPRRLDAVSFSGTGYLDDYRVSGDAMPPYLVEAWVNDTRGGRFVSLEGETLPRYIYVLPGESTNFALITYPHWTLDTILTNGAEWVGFDPVSNYFAYSSPSTNYAEFLANMTHVAAGPSIPHWWFAHYWPDSNTADFAQIATSVYNSVGMPVWQEFLAGTDPTDSNSVFEISEFFPIGDSWRVRFQCDFVNPDLPPYLVQRSTNLLDGIWETAGTITRQVGTRTFTDHNAPTNVPNVFYRIAAPAP